METAGRLLPRETGRGGGITVATGLLIVTIGCSLLLAAYRAAEVG